MLTLPDQSNLSSYTPAKLLLHPQQHYQYYLAIVWGILNTVLRHVCIMKIMRSGSKLIHIVCIHIDCALIVIHIECAVS